MPSPRAHPQRVAQSLAATLAVTLAITLAVALATLLPASAQATLLTDLQLSQVPADSAQLSFASSAGEADLTLTELSAQGAQGAGTMAGSDQFGYLGLWLGAAGRSFGTGQRGDLAATVASILLDTEARNSAPPLVAEKLREPVLMMTGLLRALNGRSDGEARGWWWGEELRQHVFIAPSVFNFYPPNFPVAGTPLVGPAFGIHNANTAFVRLNFINQMLYCDGVAPSSSVPDALGTQVDLSAFRADAADATRLEDRLVALATGGRMSAAAKARIVAAVNAWPADGPQGDWRSERVRSAAYLVFAAPAYQVLQ